MSCNQDLQKDGKPYPRTCADCGLGPCKKYGVRKDPVVLAKAIKDAVADLNELVAEAAKDELLVNYEIFPHKDTKTPHILVQVTQEVI